MMCAGCYDVDALSKQFSPADLAVSQDLAAGDLASPQDAAIDGAILPSWHVVSSGVTAPLRALALDGQILYVAGGSSTILRIDAGDKLAKDPPDPGYNLRGAAAAGGAIWVVGDDGNMLQRSNGTWTLIMGGAGNTLYGAFGLAADTVFAVGTDPGFCTAAGCDDPGILATLLSVWARTATDVFAVGQGGAIVHHDTMFTTLTSGTTADLHGVFGSGTRIFAVGQGGTILRSDNDVDWTSETSGTSSDLEAVWMAGDEAFAAGAGGVILHRDASGVWSRQHEGGPDLHAILGRSSTDVWAAGDNGTLLHHTP
jgi:hypothetical protein